MTTSTQTSSQVRMPQVVAPGMTWKEGAARFVFNGVNEAKGFMKFKASLALGVKSLLLTIPFYDDFMTFVPVANIWTIGNTLVPIGAFVIFAHVRIQKIRKEADEVTRRTQGRR